MTPRPQHRTSGPHQALIEAYLADLRHALAGLDASERDDVVGSVREHIDTALSESESEGEPSVQEVEALLGQLGSVEQIARDAGDSAARPGGNAQAAPSRDGWIAVSLAGLSLVLFWFPLVAIPLALGAGVAAAINTRAAQGAAKRRYRIAIILSTITILIGFMLGLFLVAGTGSGPSSSSSSDEVVEQPTQDAPAPTG
jgi:hypothetical protein